MERKRRQLDEPVASRAAKQLRDGGGRGRAQSPHSPRRAQPPSEADKAYIAKRKKMLLDQEYAAPGCSSSSSASSAAVAALLDYTEDAYSMYVLNPDRAPSEPAVLLPVSLHGTLKPHQVPIHIATQPHSYTAHSHSAHLAGSII